MVGQVPPVTAVTHELSTTAGVLEPLALAEKKRTKPVLPYIESRNLTRKPATNSKFKACRKCYLLKY